MRETVFTKTPLKETIEYLRKAVPMMKRVVVTVALATSLGAITAEAGGGPLTVSNSHPLFAFVGEPPFLSARPESAVLIHLNYSSTYLAGRSAQWDAHIDLETFLLEFSVSQVLGESTEVSMNIPVVSYNSGFLDGFLEWYHSTFGFSDYGRSFRPHNEFLFSVRRGGEAVVEGSPGEIALGDIRLGVKQELFQGPFAVSLFGHLELPTGNAERGYGSGGYDGGLSLLADADLPWSLTLYLNAGMVFTGTWKARKDVSLRDYPWAATGLKWRYSDNLSALVQVVVKASPYDTGIGALDDSSTLLTLGGRYAVSRKTWVEISLSEDPSISGAPDFMVEMTLKYGL